MHLKALFISNFRASGGSGDQTSAVQHRHVSLANIATAFLSERKSSSRRQNSGRRKKRLTIKGKRTSNPKRLSNYPNAADDTIGQRFSLETMEGGFATMLMTNGGTTSVNNKHRATMVIKRN
jgi:hypothetical protein